VPTVRLVFVAGGVLLVDQVAKAVAAHSATPARNPDLAFGIAGGPAPLLIVATIVVLGVFLAVVGRWAVRINASPILPAIITGGALGNVLDRARFGAVRDFVPTPFATINVADVAVMTGIGALAVTLVLRTRTMRSAPNLGQERDQVVEELVVGAR
jgi:signal peptidase II